MNSLKISRRKFIAGGSLAATDVFSTEKGSNKFLIPAKAKRVIYICHSGGQSQLDLFDYKPELKKWHGKQLPKSVIGEKRLTSNVESKAQFTVASSPFKFNKSKKTGIPFSELIPNLSDISEELCLIKSASSKEINHDPAICFLQTGSNIPGKASLGAWLNYSLGSMNSQLPSYVTMLSKSIASNQSINARLWGAAFLPSQYQGTRFFNSDNPVLFINNPVGMGSQERKEQIKLIKNLNSLKFKKENDPEITARNSNYELALNMQSSIPELTDFSKESTETLKLYGPNVKNPGSFAYNCLMARKLAEKNVRFIQLYHRGWDHHELLQKHLPILCKDIDQPSAGLIKDLKMRGLLEDTLIISTGEFGRTVFSQGALDYSFGRDHHGYCFSFWMAGAGIKKGVSYGETDDFSYNITDKKVTTQEINATILKIMGVDNNKLNYFYKGLEERLTGIEHIKYIQDILS